MAGVTEKGFVTKRLGEVVTSLKTQAKAIFQDLVKPGDEVDTGDTSALGRLIGVVSPAYDDLWQAALATYQAFDIDGAQGNALDNLAAIGGIVRFEEKAPYVDLYVTGLVGTTLYSGASAKGSRTNLSYLTQTDIVFTTEQNQGIVLQVNNLLPNQQYILKYRWLADQDYSQIVVATGNSPSPVGVLEELSASIAQHHPSLKSVIVDDRLYVDSSEDFRLHDFEVSDNLIITQSKKYVKAIAEEVSELQDFIGEVNILGSPVWGWESVTNPTPSIKGRKRETDAELRARFKNSRFDKAINIIESLYSALFQLYDVKAAVIYENDTNQVNDKGIPPHSFLTIVDGGSSVEIAQAIWQNRPTGILSVGNTQVDIVDSYGYTRTIKFSRPVEVPVYIQIDLTTDSRFPSDGEEQIKNALIAYVNQRQIQTGVVYSRLYTPINTVPGHQVNSLLIGKDPSNLSTNNIELSYDEVARTSDVRITFVR